MRSIVTCTVNPAIDVAAGTAALLSPGTELCRTEDAYRLAPEIAIEELTEVPAHEY